MADIARCSQISKNAGKYIKILANTGRYLKVTADIRRYPRIYEDGSKYKSKPPLGSPYAHELSPIGHIISNQLQKGENHPQLPRSVEELILDVQVPLKKYLNIWTENRDNTRIIQGYFRDISEVRHLLEVSVHRLTGVILVRIS